MNSTVLLYQQCFLDITNVRLKLLECYFSYSYICNAIKVKDFNYIVIIKIK